MIRVHETRQSMIEKNSHILVKLPFCETHVKVNVKHYSAGTGVIPKKIFYNIDMEIAMTVATIAIAIATITQTIISLWSFVRAQKNESRN